MGLVALALVAVAAPAYGGGSFLDVSAGSGSVWVAGEIGVVQVDARTGRQVRRLVLGPIYPMSIALGDGAAWVASVEQGFVSGTVTRIDTRTGATRTVLHRVGWPAEQVAVAGHTVWVSFGSRVGRFDLGGRLLGVTHAERNGGWLAADSAGAWFCCHAQRLLRIDPAGRLHASFTLPVADPIWAGLGSIWLDDLTTLDRIDERTGRVLARIPLRSAQSVAVGGGAVYALGFGSLVRIDPRTNRITARRRLRGVTHAVSVGPGGVWATAVLSHPPADRVLRLNGRTLATELTVVLY